MTTQTTSREREIYRVTVGGGVVNALLLLLKFAAGIWGHSAAMIADAVHSLTDFLTDVVVVIFVRLSSKPRDEDHEYGHGKYETLAAALIGVALLACGMMIFWDGAVKIAAALCGEHLEQPGTVALWAAVVSIAAKECVYRVTARVGRRIGSEVVIANAWHHRSDALSSVGTLVGIGGAIVLGERWAVLDPVAAVVVSVFILRAAYEPLRHSVGELLEESLPREVEAEIVRIAEETGLVSDVHNVRTRRIGSSVAMEMDVRMPGNVSLYKAHRAATEIEHRLKQRFGEKAHINVHVEPVKIDGEYRES